MQNTNSSRKILVVGATGGSGRATVASLLDRGYEVSVLARRAGAFSEEPRVTVIAGDAMNFTDVERAVRGHDTVIVTLGISENALRVRFLGSRHTPMDVRSRGTQHVIDAMKKHGVKKLIVQSSFGVGETRSKLPLLYRAMFALLLKPQIADTEVQEAAVRASGLDWVLAQPVNLTDVLDDAPAFASASGETRKMKISRKSVGRFLVEAAERAEYVGRSFALSGS